MRTKHFHEDDYCRQEFLPIEAWDYCEIQLADLSAFNEKYKTEFGWTEVYMRGSPPFNLTDIVLLESDVRSALGEVLMPFETVTTGNLTHREPCQGVNAYGFERRLSLFVEEGSSDRVKAMWLDPYGVQPEEVEAVSSALSSLPSAPDLLFVDWAWHRLFRVGDIEAWQSYLHDHADGTGYMGW